MNFLRTFRGKLLMILTALIVATLGIQFYLNYLTQQDNIERRDTQAEALVAGFSVGTTALSSPEERVIDIVNRPGPSFLDDESRAQIIDIIVINNQWQITDSLSEEYWPDRLEDGSYKKKKLGEILDLPPLMNGDSLGSDVRNFPNKKTDSNKFRDDEAHAIPIDTSEGRWYVMVLLRSDKSEAGWRAARPLLVTLAVLLISTLITFLLVLRFTRPIANLSEASREIAAGNLNVRVPDGQRTDELGELSMQFNQMTAELEKTRELERQLREAEKSAVIGRLGSAIAHEIRNPLNYINLTLDHLRSKYSPDDELKRENYKKMIGQLKAEVARINQQITDFLNYSRPPSPKLEAIPARNPIDESLHLIEGQAGENDIKISVIEEEGVKKILADPEYLRSVFNNLFINAVQAIGTTGGSLIIRVQQDNEHVKYTISDTGVGIDPENLSKIFEPYFSTKETGTGLGLAIVQRIVDIHHGTISVDSKLNEGTTFTVRLPTVKE